LAAELAAATPSLNAEEQHLTLALYRLLAKGQPVERATLASRSNLEPEQVDEALERWPGVFADEDERIIGFWGLSLRPMAHRLLVDDRVLYAWCAWDTLFLPELLGKPAQVQSTCPTTARPISLAVSQEAITDVAPAATVLSFVHRDQPFDADSITTFCHYIHFFADEAAAQEWIGQHGSLSRSPTASRSPAAQTQRGSQRSSRERESISHRPHRRRSTPILRRSLLGGP